MDENGYENDYQGKTTEAPHTPHSSPSPPQQLEDSDTILVEKALDSSTTQVDSHEVPCSLVGFLEQPELIDANTEAFLQEVDIEDSTVSDIL